MDTSSDLSDEETETDKCRMVVETRTSCSPTESDTSLDPSRAPDPVLCQPAQTSGPAPGSPDRPVLRTTREERPREAGNVRRASGLS